MCVCERERSTSGYVCYLANHRHIKRTVTIRNKNPSLKSYQVGENGSGKTTLVSSYIPKAHSYKEGFNAVMFWF